MEDYAFFKKCGDITISPDKKRFGLNCIICNGICMQFDVFMQHIQEMHCEDINDLYKEEGEQQKQQPQQNDIITGLNEFNVKVNDSDWSEMAPAIAPTTITTTTNTMNALATLLSGVDFELEMNDIPPEEAAELQELVYIMDDNSLLNMEDEEETVEPFAPAGNLVDDKPETTTTTIMETQEKGRDLETPQSISENSFNTLDELLMDELTSKSSEYTKSHEKATTNLHTPKIPTSTTITPMTRQSEYNREVIIYLLEAYRKNAKLWNPQHPQYKYNAPRNIFDELAGPLKNDLNVSLSGAEIFKILNSLRSRYRRELTKISESKDDKKTNLWYFDKIDFLRDIIENKRAERETKHRIRIANPIASPPINKPTKNVQSKGNLSFLLEAYKHRESLWNPEHSDFEDCDKRKWYEEISKYLIKEQNIELSAEMCKFEMEKLITRYRKELNELSRRKGLYVPKLWCFEQMDFLKRIYEAELQKRKRRRKGIVTMIPKSKLNKASEIVFKNFDEQLKFVEIYKAYPALWSTDHPDFRSVKYREQATNEMLSQINVAFGLNASLLTLEKTIFNLRKAFSSEKLKLLSSINTNDDTNESSFSSSSTSSSAASMSPQLYAYFASFLAANVGPFRCDICQMIIKTCDQYKMHKSGHDGSMPFICVICGKGFYISGNLAIHIRRHKRDFPYSCEECNKSFATSTEVTIHQRVHTGARPYVCDLCGKRFKTWSFFDIHRRVHLNQSAFLCPICDKGFYEKNRYTAHMNGHLNIRKHSCKVCSKSFTTIANLKKHNELHLPERKYKCDTCDTRFAQFASLRWHKRKMHCHEALCESNALEQ